MDAVVTELVIARMALAEVGRSDLAERLEWHEHHHRAPATGKGPATTDEWNLMMRAFALGHHLHDEEAHTYRGSSEASFAVCCPTCFTETCRLHGGRWGVDVVASTRRPMRSSS